MNQKLLLFLLLAITTLTSCQKGEDTKLEKDLKGQFAGPALIAEYRMPIPGGESIIYFVAFESGSFLTGSPEVLTFHDSKTGNAYTILVKEDEVTLLKAKKLPPVEKQISTAKRLKDNDVKILGKDCMAYEVYNNFSKSIEMCFIKPDEKIRPLVKNLNSMIKYTSIGDLPFSPSDYITGIIKIRKDRHRKLVNFSYESNVYSVFPFLNYIKIK